MGYYDVGSIQGFRPNDTNKYCVGEYMCLPDTNQKGIFGIKTKWSDRAGYRMYIFSTDGVNGFNYDGSTNFYSYVNQSSHLGPSGINSNLEGREKSSPDGYVYPEGSWTIARGNKLQFTSYAWGKDGNEIGKATFPIYDFSQTDYPDTDMMDKVNKYITEGDDSGADNYNDLHPDKYDTTVWLDGTFPNIYYKTVYSGDGEPPAAPSCLCVISAIPTVSPVEMVRTNYNIDSMNFVSYGQYSNPTAVPLVSKTPYGIAFNLNDDANKKCQVTFYIDKSGNVSDIAPASSADGTHTIHVETGTPSEQDYSDGSNANGFDTNPTQNKFSGANTLTKTYKLASDAVALKALGNFLWSSTFKDNVLSLTNYPLENIIAIKAMPLIVGGGSEEIKIGNVLTGVSGDVVADADSIETTVGTKRIPRYFNNFIDYNEVDIMIYLPYIGFKKIDNLVAMKRSLRVKYYFDVIMGNCLASLEFKADTGNWLLYDCYQGNCGIDIALTSTNRASIENGFINNALSAVSDIMSLNPVGVAKDVFNGMTQDFHSQSTGVGNPSVMNALDTTCRLIIKRPATYEPKEYGHTVGYPCYKYMNLSELSGFTQCENFICSLIPYATDGEKAEIKSLLESGIFIF